jgi:hypothetical protein
LAESTGPCPGAWAGFFLPALPCANLPVAGGIVAGTGWGFWIIGLPKPRLLEGMTFMGDFPMRGYPKTPIDSVMPPAYLIENSFRKVLSMPNRSFFGEVTQIYASLFVVGTILVFSLFKDIVVSLFRAPKRILERVRSN